MKNNMYIFVLIGCFIVHCYSNAQSVKFILITSVYNEMNIQRAAEYITCLKKNLANPIIKAIHVLYDTSRDGTHNAILDFLKAHNIVIHYIKGRPSFHDCFALANTLFLDGAAIILTNADIYFNETLKKIQEVHLQNTVLALTRWNVTSAKTLEIQRLKDGRNNEHSQDTWIFRVPLHGVQCQNIFMGTWRCDGRIAYEIARSGVCVLNPCLSVQCCHLHESKTRNYARIEPIEKRIKVPWTTL